MLSQPDHSILGAVAFITAALFIIHRRIIMMVDYLHFYLHSLYLILH